MDYNYKKRDYLLPEGCKDLADVLRLQAGATDDSVQRFIRDMVLQADRANAAEILITAPILGDGDCFIMQRIKDTFLPVATVYAAFRAGLVAQLLRTAVLSETIFPAQGVATYQFGERQSKWYLHIESAGAEFRLIPYRDPP